MAHRIGRGMFFCAGGLAVMAFTGRQAQATDRSIPGTAAHPIAGTAPQSAAGERLHWRSSWQEFTDLDYAVSFGAASLGVGLLVWGPARQQANPFFLPFDRSTRRSWRASTSRGRLWARDASDVLEVLLASYPIIGDGLLNAGWYRQSPEVAKQMLLLNLEANAVSAGITNAVKALVLRERPYGQECGEGLDAETRDCADIDRYHSHFSAHSSVSFVAASLTCVHHANLPLWGETSWWIPCAGGYALASTTAVLRVVADRHYLSDVVVGAVVGTLTGLLIPWLHYSSAGDGPAGNASASGSDLDQWLGRHRVGLLPNAQSLAITGVF